MNRVQPFVAALAALAIGLGPPLAFAAEPAPAVPAVQGPIKATAEECALVGLVMTSQLRPGMNRDVYSIDGPYRDNRAGSQDFAVRLRARLPTLTPALALEFAQDIMAPAPYVYYMDCDWAAYGQPARVEPRVCFAPDGPCETIQEPMPPFINVARPWISRSGQDALVRLKVPFSVDQGDSYICHLRRTAAGWTIAGCQRQQY
ncbi:hypothetical protein QO010_003454 [Caulobacter ginsengisoli]|uniref:Uncharacterized protein n=1 Tax=Caulobacter ginsengisoli TaxID=400775 RepID=A0ABU0IUH5_9CAUL|nr:hypothetical protein [Caulobacter ginsengisoli]MDQ0465665.1 hypothetical protein [Caulobacter ginsengisoli]